jgi:glycosyltransferase involved in cell wall biosynthesis
MRSTVGGKDFRLTLPADRILGRGAMLAVIETHPVQYHAPLYRLLQQRFGIPVTAIYGSDCSVAAYHDQEFGMTFAWDTDLLSGYSSVFLSRAPQTGASSSPQRASARGLGRALRDIAPKAVLLTGYSPRFHQLAFLEARRAGCPILFRGETTDHARPRSWLRERARDLGLRWMYGRCARLLYVGQRSYQHFSRLGLGDGKLAFSPYCVDTTPFDPDEVGRARLRAASRARLGLSGEQSLVLFSGKLSLRKGPDLLLQAIKELRAAPGGNLVAAFMGSGQLQPALCELARAEPRVDARFLGFQNQTGLSSYYHAADLFALPSRHSETWGLVVNEALHHGLPCVVSDAVGCAPDFIEPGRTGEVFESRSARSLATALQRGLALIGRPDVRAWCRDKVSGYSIEKAAAGIAEAYRAVVR